MYANGKNSIEREISMTNNLGITILETRGGKKHRTWVVINETTKIQFSNFNLLEAHFEKISKLFHNSGL